jgi:hypothetical protein
MNDEDQILSDGIEHHRAGFPEGGIIGPEGCSP